MMDRRDVLKVTMVGSAHLTLAGSTLMRSVLAEPISGFAIASAIGTAIGAVSQQNFQRDFNSSIGKIDSQLAEIEARLDNIIKILKQIPRLIDAANEQQFRKETDSIIFSRSKTLKDLEAPITDIRKVDKERRTDIRHLGTDVLGVGFQLMRWGPIGYPSVAEALVVGLRCYVIAGVDRKTLSTACKQYEDWFNVTSKTFFALAVEHKAQHDTELARANDYPRHVRLGTGGGTNYYAILRPKGRCNFGASDFSSSGDVKNGYVDAPVEFRRNVNEDFAKGLIGRICNNVIGAAYDRAEAENGLSEKASTQGKETAQIAKSIAKWRSKNLSNA